MPDDPFAPDQVPPPPEDDYDRAPQRELTPAQQAVVFRAQLILFLIMGFFIIAPFVVWWWLSRGR